jgi:hypothetical protein
MKAAISGLGHFIANTMDIGLVLGKLCASAVCGIIRYILLVPEPDGTADQEDAIVSVVVETWQEEAKKGNREEREKVLLED